MVLDADVPESQTAVQVLQAENKVAFLGDIRLAAVGVLARSCREAPLQNRPARHNLKMVVLNLIVVMFYFAV